MRRDKGDKNILSGIKKVCKDNIMLVIFALFAVFTSVASGQTLLSMINDITIRFFRNFLLTLSLILPIVAGIGLNFGITLGAIGSELAIVIVLASGGYTSKVGGLLYWIILTIVICIIAGYLLAKLFNATKGQEMISGLFVGFFSTGIYMFFLMIVFGKIIKLSDPSLVVATGQAIKATINLPVNLFQGLDNLYKFPLIYALVGIYMGYIVKLIIDVRKMYKTNGVVKHTKIVCAVIVTASVLYLFLHPGCSNILKSVSVPLVTGAMGLVIASLIWWLIRTKLGHDFLAIKYDIGISASVGINVDRTRTIAIILSTIFAGLGQLVYIQNLGTMQTYNMHGTTATFTIAAILFGGATIKHASVKNAVIGTILFNCIYSTAPNAAKNLLGNIQIGEYFRTFMCYGIIAIAIVAYAMKEVRIAKERMRVRS